MGYENRPMFVDETPGIKNYCTCGESANKPYCDGSHSAKATGKVPKEFMVDVCLLQSPHGEEYSCSRYKFIKQLVAFTKLPS